MPTAADAQNRDTENKALNRNASNKDVSKKGGQPNRKAKDAEGAKNKLSAKPPSPEPRPLSTRRRPMPTLG
jgi:hypothetical protein